MKLKKIVLLLAVILVFSSILAACGTDAIGKDLINYSNVQLPTIVDLEKSVSDDFASVTGKNYTDDATMAAKLKDFIIPNSDALIKKAEAIKPTTDEVNTVHGKYLAAVKTQNEAFILYLDAIEKVDAAKVQVANDKLKEATTLSDKYNVAVKALGADHGVEFKK